MAGWPPRHGPAPDTAEAAHNVQSPQGVVLEKLAAVEHGADKFLHIVGLLGRTWDEVGQFRHGAVRVVGRRQTAGIEALFVGR